MNRYAPSIAYGPYTRLAAVLVSYEIHPPLGRVCKNAGSMTGDQPIVKVDLGKLAKPATTLIEKISGAVGIVYEPTKIRREAKAKGEAKLIELDYERRADIARHEAAIEIGELERRALTRFVSEEAKKQQNMESVIQGALPHLSESSDPSNIEDDWITNFFDKSRIVSDAEMQKLWSAVLAGEANEPGRFSQRTVTSLSSLDKFDATLFTRLCAFGWIVGGRLTFLVYEGFDEKDSPYAKRGITFSALSHLDDIGLIKFENLAGFTRGMFEGQATMFYYGTPYELTFSTKTMMNIGSVLPTRVGEQLAPITQSQAGDDARDFVLEHWKKLGYLGEPPAPSGG